MSELQKWITSISGAVVGQMAVLGFFYLLVFNSASPNLSAKSTSPRPREVTVMLSQTGRAGAARTGRQRSRTGTNRTRTREDTPPEPSPTGKQFVDTDSSTAQVDAPKDSRFESDRNHPRLDGISTRPEHAAGSRPHPAG